MKKQIYIILFITGSFLLVSCNQPKTEWKGTIDEKDGVIVVKNPKEPMYDQSVFQGCFSETLPVFKSFIHFMNK